MTGAAHLGELSKADLFSLASAEHRGLSSTIVHIDVGCLADDSYRARLGVFVEALGEKRWGVAPSSDDGVVEIRIGAGCAALEGPHNLSSVVQLNPGQLREYVRTTAEWWGRCAPDERGIFGRIRACTSLSGVDLVKDVATLLHDDTVTIASYSGPMWAARFLHRLVATRGGRVIPSCSNRAANEFEPVVVHVGDAPIELIPTWAALCDLAGERRVQVVANQQSLALYADAIVSEGLEAVSASEFANQSSGSDIRLVRQGFSLRQSVTSGGITPGTSDVEVPSLAAPSRSSLRMLSARQQASGSPEVAIWAPPIHPSSGGTSILYRLAGELQKRGITAGIMPIGPRRLFGRLVPDFPDARYLLSPGQRALIHIQPETLNVDVPGRHRIMWELYFRGELPFNGGRITEARGNPDLVVTHSASLSASDPRLYLSPVDFDLFRPGGFGIRDGILLYIGKAHSDPRFVIPPEYLAHNPLIIHRSWPTRTVVADLFRSAELLVSLDPFSSTNTEATLCGCPVLVDTRYARQGAESDLQRFEFGLEGFVFDTGVSEAKATRIDASSLWERLRADMARVECEDVDRFVSEILTPLA